MATIRNLPPQSTSFIGRRIERKDITNLIMKPECRLLTLVGPGGIGKTRLAIAVATTIDAFADGVYFADLQPLTSVDTMVTTIARAVGFTPFGQDDPRDQLMRYLADKELLIVADNVEHLLDGADFFTAILDAAPAIKVLVTSRQVLNLKAEWLYRTHGLLVPAEDSRDDAEKNDAVALFTARARQICPSFSLQIELPHVIQICRLVEGMPLALELAAQWLKTLTCADIVAEIEHGLDILTTTVHDIPERFQSIESVFAPTWARLSDDEQDAYMRLTVFRGDFDRAAAEQVAYVSLPLLAQLSNRALLNITPDRRYRMHELVRQYGEARLRECSGACEDTRDRHCAYYLDFLRDQLPDLKSPRVGDALQRIEREFDNIRYACAWVTSPRWAEKVSAALHSLGFFFNVRAYGLSREKLNILRSLRTAMADEHAALRGRIRMWEAWYLVNQGITQPAEQVMTEGLALVREHETYGVAVEALYFYAALFFHGTPEMLADFTQYIHDNLAWFRHEHDLYGEIMSLLALREICARMDQPAHNTKYGLEAITLARQLGHPFCIVHALWFSDSNARGKRRYDDAMRVLDEIAINAEKLEMFGEMGAVLIRRGETMRQAGSHREARRWYEAYVEMWADVISHNEWLMEALIRLAEYAAQDGHNRLMRHFLRQALTRLADQACAEVLRADALAAIAWVLRIAGQTAQSDALAAATLPHVRELSWAEAVWQDRFVEMRNWIDDEAEQERAESPDLGTVAAALLDELNAEDVVWMNHELMMLLTPRELDVLEHMVAGATNRAIAARLHLAVGTVKKHLHHIYDKLGVTSRADAIECIQSLTGEVDDARKKTGASLDSENRTLPEHLTPRELTVLRLVAADCSSEEISLELSISLGTVKNHIHKICGKLEVRNRHEAVECAQTNHIL